MSVFRVHKDQKLWRTLLLAFCWFLLVRVAFLLHSGVLPEPGRMLLSDLAGAAVLTGLLMLARTPLLRGLLVVCLGALMMASAMHLSAHGTYPRLALVSKGTDPVFLASSVFNWQLLLLPIYLGLAGALVGIYHWRSPHPPRQIGLALVLIVTTTGLYLAASNSLTTARNNVVASMLAQLPGAVLAPAGKQVGHQVAKGATPDADDDYFHAATAPSDIDRPPNVLLIMVEGLSAGYFPSISDYHSLAPGITLAHLERVLRDKDFRLYRNVLSMERQTDRGSFAILCGRYPDFQRLSTKVADVANGEAFPVCMPELLRANGYTTAYWQAAPLSYMSKDRFMPRAGFTRVTGADAFQKEGEPPEGWGPPDPVFYRDVAQRLKALDRSESRWLVTLLNVGTHHPFNTGGEVASTADGDEPLAIDPLNARRNAMLVMEEALIGFLEELEQAGALDNTLIILTSDESRGFARQDRVTFPLNGNTGLLAIRTPRPGQLDDYADRDRIVAQIDIPLTILDATGTLAPPSVHMTGRSLLSRNDRVKRELLLADTYTGMKYFLRETGQLLACTESLLRCDTWRFSPGRLFGSLAPSDGEPFLTLEERLWLFEQAAELPTGPSTSNPQ